MYADRDFTSISEDTSARVFGFDLAATLASGETIQSLTSGLILQQGGDPTPSTHLVGSPQFSGSLVTQMVSWVGDPLGAYVGNIYGLMFGATTSLGETILPWSRITIDQSFGSPVTVSGSAPVHAQVVTLPTPGPSYILPTLGDYAQRDFPVIDQGEQRSYGFDFSPALSPNEMIMTAQAWLRVLKGVDAAVTLDATARFIGSPTISGSIVRQMIGMPPSPLLIPSNPEYPDLRGVVYALNVTVTTSFSQAIGTWARLRIGTLFG